MDKVRLAAKVLVALVALMATMGGLVFVPAGTLHYWQAWAFLATFFMLATVFSFLLLLYDPRLLERRMKWGEKEPWQRLVMGVVSVLYFAGFVVAGYDHRYGWSNVPPWLVIASDALILAGYAFVYRVFQENTFAASVVEVEPEQRVISTGPYAIVRHPMYLGALPIVTLIPLALGSYWGLLVFAPLPALLVMRLLNEEQVLVRDLPGYEDYRRKVRWRLLPGVW
jgi:protein-S-isoprenylcysteine O-methyltransferase Ste14